MSIKRIVPDITSERMDESRKFYAEFLGLEMAMDMASADMPCCPNSDKDHQGAKADMCASMCAAMTQAALPLPVAVFIPDATSLTYDYADSVAPDRLLPPDSPPPKA